MGTWRAWPLETESMTSRVLSFAHEPVSFALWFTALAASCAVRLASFACEGSQLLYGSCPDCIAEQSWLASATVSSIHAYTEV